MQSILDQSRAPIDELDLSALKEDAQQLFRAVTEGQLDEVKKLLPLNAAAASTSSASTDAVVLAPISVNVADSAGFTPIMISARMEHEDVTRYLLSLPGIDVNARSNNGNTPFLYACAKSSVAIVRGLLEAGANFFARNENGDDCLMCASIGGHQAVFDFVVQAYHNIRTARLPANQHKPWEQGKQSPKKFFTMRNEESLTPLMCAVMSGSRHIVERVLLEARRELGVNIVEPAPSAKEVFFPSILGWALKPAHWKPPSKLVDPSPLPFLQYVDAANLMGDTALHIAAENQSLELYTLLLETAGADPMKVNRRGKRTFELFQSVAQQKKATVEEVTPESEKAEATAASSSSSSTATPIVDKAEQAHLVLEQILIFQQLARNQFLEHEARESEKRFEELMDEEESKLLGGGGGKKKKKDGAASTAAGAAGGKKKKAKKGASGTTASTAHATKDDSKPTPAVDTDNESTASEEDLTSPRIPAAVPTSAPSIAAATTGSPLALSPAAAPFVPLAELAALDAASGWETVKPKEKKPASVAAAAPVHTGATTTAKSKKKPAVAEGPSEPKASPPRKGKAAAGATKSSKSKSTEKGVEIAATTIALAPSASEAAPSSLFAAGSAAPRTPWHPLTALQRRASPETSTSSNATSAVPVSPSGNQAASSGASSLSHLQYLLTSLHPHIESTDLQLEHFLGDSWSSLSMSQLSTLEEVYAALSRQIRETQFTIFQQQQQEMMSELVRTKSEVNALRKEIAASTKREI